MTTANARQLSHIRSDLSASLLRTANEIAEAVQDKDAQNAPILLQKYRSNSSNSTFYQLSMEIELLIISACEKNAFAGAAFKLGLTSKYWHLRIRNYIEDDPEGQCLGRAHDLRQYIKCRGKTPTRVAHDFLSVYRKFFHAMTPDVISRQSGWPACVAIKVSSEERCSYRFSEALAKYKSGVGILDTSPSFDSIKFVVRAINATPRGSYIALLIPPDGPPDNHLEDLSNAIKKYPVVCLVAVTLPDRLHEPLPKQPNLSLLRACIEKQVDWVKFRFEYENFGEEEAHQLDSVLRKVKTKVSVEIFARRASIEGRKMIVQAVRSFNQTSDARVTLTCCGPQLSMAGFKELGKDGIYIENTTAYGESFNSFSST